MIIIHMIIIRVLIYIYICICICVYKNIYLCIYIYIYIYNMCIYWCTYCRIYGKESEVLPIAIDLRRLDGTKWNWGPRPAEIRSGGTFESSNHIELILELNRIDHASNGQYIYVVWFLFLLLLILSLLLIIFTIYTICSFIFEGLEPLRNWAISIRRTSPSAPLLKAATSHRPGGSKLPIKLHFLVVEFD